MGIIDVFYPKICVGCRREGNYICSECQRKLIKPEPICPMCTKPSLDGWTHPRCRRRLGMDRLIVGLPYKGCVQSCLKSVKYKSSWDMIGFLCNLQRLEIDLQDSVLTCVPMWDQKVRERGYNQAEMIAELVAKQYMRQNYALLERIKQTRPMYRLNKQERWENVEGVFRINNQQANKLTGKRVVIVDDVWTTGATMRECARVLKTAGACEVWGITIAR